MNQELATTQAQQNQMLAQLSAKAGLPSSVNAGAVAIEQERAIAEAQGKLALAKRFPRDLTKAHAELMTACKSRAFAEQAFYSVPNRGAGPSIRFAEEVAQAVGNFKYGHRELSRGDGKSEVEVFAWDMEKNNESTRQITVLHIQDSKTGSRPLRDQADIDNRIANVASKQMRGRILALLPKWLVAEAILECRKTLAGTNDEPISVRVRKMTQAFAKFGVTTDHLATYLGHKLDEVMVDELVDLQGVYNAIKEGTPPSDFFGAKEEAQAEPEKKAAETIQAAAKAGAVVKTKKPVPTQNQAAAETSQTAAPTVQQAVESVQQESNVDQNNSNSVKAESAEAEPKAVHQEAVQSAEPVSDPEAEGDVF